MKISDFELLLATLRKELGDVEIYEAKYEYGRTDITLDSFKELVRLETDVYQDGRPSENYLVVGRHMKWMRH